MKELSIRCGKSQQAIYKLINKNPELLSLIDKHSERNGRFINYDDEVLNWLINHSKPVDRKDCVSPVGAGDLSSTNRDEENPKYTSPDSVEEQIVSELRARVEELSRENEALKNTIENLKLLVERERNEREDIVKQNGLLLLILNQEKQEKQALLPPPRVSLTEKVIKFFKREKKEKDEKK